MAMNFTGVPFAYDDPKKSELITRAEHDSYHKSLYIYIDKMHFCAFFVFQLLFLQNILSFDCRTTIKRDKLIVAPLNQKGPHL